MAADSSISREHAELLDTMNYAELLDTKEHALLLSSNSKLWLYYWIILYGRFYDFKN